MRFRVSSVAAGLATSASIAVLAGTMMLFSAAEASSETPQAAVEAPRPPQGLWSREAIDDLVAEVQASAGEGLDPGAYDVAGLQRAVAASDIAEADRRATALALALADDYANGLIKERSRYDWHIESAVASPEKLAADLRTAIAAGHTRLWLRSLLPTDPRYAALRTAFATAADPAMRDRLRVNLERWKWMPRTLGADHIYVNVPSYTLAVVEGGQAVSNYTVVVGSPRTPTPQLNLTASAIVVNPYWYVPDSIARNGLGAGYERINMGGTLRYRQAPGPRNALGKIKIDMPNAHAIYLHDTPSKALFERDSRAFSHGCIRVKDIERLAAELVEDDAATSVQLARAAAGSANRTLRLDRTLPVYLVYFTADVGADGRVVALEDPYGRDRRLLADLHPVQMAAATTPQRRSAT